MKNLTEVKIKSSYGEKKVTITFENEKLAGMFGDYMKIIGMDQFFKIVNDFAKEQIEKYGN